MSLYRDILIFCCVQAVIILVCHGCGEYSGNHSTAAAAKRYRAALVYLKSRGIDEETDKGIALLIRSADDDYVLAQNKLGFLYAEGQLVPRDPDSAYTL